MNQETKEKERILQMLFIERIENSKLFSNNEILEIKNSITQYEKCYLLGSIDFFT